MRALLRHVYADESYRADAHRHWHPTLWWIVPLGCALVAFTTLRVPLLAIFVPFAFCWIVAAAGVALLPSNLKGPAPPESDPLPAPPTGLDATITWACRAALVGVVAAAGVWSQPLHAACRLAWAWAVRQPWFTTVFFETVYAAWVYMALLSLYFWSDRMPWLQRYRCGHRRTTGKAFNAQFGRYASQLFLYVLPFLVLDLWTVKRFPGVPQARLDAMPCPPTQSRWFGAYWSLSCVQQERLLPLSDVEVAVPSVHLMLWHCLLACVVYDVAFAVIHFALHHVTPLWRWIHSHHHNHPHGITSDVTAQLNVVETLLLVLSANWSLNVVGAHPLTRILFVPLLLGLLVDNHGGYVFPWSPCRIVPMSLMGGAPAHDTHHAQPTRDRHYEPFFTFLTPVFTALTHARDLKRETKAC